MGNWCFFTPINGVLWGPPGRKLGCPSASSSTNGTSRSYSYLRWEIHFSEGHVYRESCHVGICLYIYIHIPGNPYCHFVLVKTHFSSFFVDYGFFCQIRYFSNLRVRFFPTTCWKNMGLLRVTASTLIKYKTKYAYGHFLEHYGAYPA